jgi:16S rRNA (uracil1498-N3)-methyltransferase
MNIFYAPGISGNSWILDEKESKHCIRVLRMKEGVPVKLIDGKGNLYEGEISKPDPRACEIKIHNIISDFEKRSYSIHIAISPLKNPERFEWFVEKSVEIGINEITPLICKNTVKQNIKSERIKNTIISAMKQSLKADLTTLNDPVPFNKFMAMDFHGTRLIAHCNQSSGNRVSMAESYDRGEDVLILIGPEGDFDATEIDAAIKSGFKAVHLGVSRLRTETAGVAACHSIYFLNQ